MSLVGPMFGLLRPLRNEVCLILGLSKSLRCLKLCPFFSELFLPWLYDGDLTLSSSHSDYFLPCCTLHWLIFHRACLDINVTQTSVSYLFFISYLFSHISFIWERLLFHGAKCYLSIKDFQINIQLMLYAGHLRKYFKVNMLKPNLSFSLRSLFDSSYPSDFIRSSCQNYLTVILWVLSILWTTYLKSFIRSIIQQ